ncbi:MYPU_1760 family metalloprotease [Mycoplasma marinum]|uniref:Uncharacterized protein n=1 Tax=Mycoplasma marinum TaxID=1937190 RepID=A0A4R0XPL0_9MOLU|nr:hypothetical protein [Mycoplasma marinum]TCG10825.1 hypothetical protein C4B24_03795 [Mycoplasma marinum]
MAIKKWKIAIAILGGFIFTGSIAVLTFAIIRNNNRKVKDENAYPYREMKNAKEIWYNSDKPTPNSNWDFKIKIYPYDNNKYWLNDNEMQALKQILKEKLYHGPEITDLKEIVLGNTNVIKKDSGGLYYPQSKQIFINIEDYKNASMTTQDKLHAIISTITHEYGHHIEGAYLTSETSQNGWKGDNKFLQNGTTMNKKGSSRHWNKNFMDSFYKSLNYNNTSTITKSSKPIGESIASTYSLSDLFWKSLKNIPKTNFGVWNLFNDREEDLIAKETLQQKNTRIRNHIIVKAPIIPSFDAENANYRYSFDEIVTRQLGQLMHVYDIPPIYNGANKETFGLTLNKFQSPVIEREDGTKGYKYIYNTFVSDLAHSVQLIQIQGQEDKIRQIGFDYDTKEVYLKQTNPKGFYKDYMFGKNGSASIATEVYNAFTKAMGYGKLISNVRVENKVRFNYEILHNSRKLTDIINNAVNYENIKISGFAPENISGIYYGDKNKINPSKLKKFSSINERKKLWNFQRKRSVFGSLDSSISKMPETPGKWIPYNVMVQKDPEKNKTLYWWMDKNNNHTLDKDELLETKQLKKMGLDIHKKPISIPIKAEDIYGRDSSLNTFRYFYGDYDSLNKRIEKINFNKDDLSLTL